MQLEHTLHTIALQMAHDRDDREIAVGYPFLILDGKRKQRAMSATSAGMEIALQLDDPNHGGERALLLRESDSVGPRVG
ncbi:MAG: hypothetical protein ACYDCK_01935 [Thermoplasmatota archaeon]